MNTPDKIRLALGLFVVFTFFGLILNGGNIIHWKKSITEDFAQELREQGFIVKDGSVESPIAIFDIDYEEFMEVVEDSPIVVLDYYYLYCFSPDYVWGYKYEIQVEPDHPLFWVYPIGKWHHDKS